MGFWAKKTKVAKGSAFDSLDNETQARLLMHAGDIVRAIKSIVDSLNPVERMTVGKEIVDLGMKLMTKVAALALSSDDDMSGFLDVLNKLKETYAGSMFVNRLIQVAKESWNK